MIPNKFSYSSLTLYQDCPRCWWLKYVAKIRQRGVSHNLVIGKILHEYLEYENKEKPNIDLLIKKHLPKPPEFLKGCGENELIDSVRLLTLLANKYPLSIKLVESEKEFNIPLDGNIINGFIDGITENDEILEHKTSSVKYTLDMIHDSHQGRIYTLAFQQLKGKLPTKIIYDVFYKSKMGIRELISTTFTEQELNETREWIHGLVNMIKVEQFTPYNPIGYLHRGWCEYKNLCKYCHK